MKGELSCVAISVDMKVFASPERECCCFKETERRIGVLNDAKCKQGAGNSIRRVHRDEAKDVACKLRITSRLKRTAPGMCLAGGRHEGRVRRGAANGQPFERRGVEERR